MSLGNKNPPALVKQDKLVIAGGFVFPLDLHFSYGLFIFPFLLISILSFLLFQRMRFNIIPDSL